MADLPISGLPELTGTGANDLLVIVASGTTYKIPYSALTKDFAINKVSGVGHLPVFSGNNTYVTSIIHETLDVPYLQRTVHIGHYDPYHDPLNPDKLGVYAGETDSYNLVVGRGEIDNYLQFNCRNFSSGSTASSDIVATADNGTEEEFYIDMGINSSQYSATTLVGSVNDAYVYSTGNDLFIGNASPNKRLVLFNGGFDTSLYSKLFIHEDGYITINTDQYDLQNPAALRVVNANTGSTSMIHCDSNIDNFAAITSANVSSGESASAVISATNDLNELNQDEGYVEMGINGSNYNLAANVGSAGDAFMYSTGNDLYIGNATPAKRLILFNGGFDAFANAKMFIHPDGSITINTPDVDPLNPSALRIINANGSSTSMIRCDSDIDDFSEVNVVNANSGSQSSADVVATNNINEVNPNSGYIDMGINSSTYNVPNNVGGPSDAYLYSTGNKLFIGNATETAESIIHFFTNGPYESNYWMSILSDGSVGVHNPLPEYPLDISGTTKVRGNLFVTSQTNLGTVIEAADNADAILSGLTAGDVYRTGDFLKIVH